MSRKPFPITCVPENAERFAMWIRERGGICLWKSLNLSNPGASWCTPFTTEDGQEAGKPNWQTESTPAVVVTSMDEVGVEIPVEVKRIKISLIRRGLKVVLTDGSTRKVRDAVEKAGDGAFYTFEDDMAVIWAVRGTVCLEEWLAAIAEPFPTLGAGEVAILSALDELGNMRGFMALRYEYEHRTGSKTDNDSIRILMRSMLDRNLVNKELLDGAPIPLWCLNARGLEALKRSRAAKPVEKDSQNELS